MSLSFQVLGQASADNALYVEVDSGQAIERLLFDCGSGCAADIPEGALQKIDALFFSHLHMDHVGGFDSFFRANYDRAAQANQIWGPPGTSEIMQHRMQGYMWNLHADMSAAWRVHDVNEDVIGTTRFELGEAFAAAHSEGDRMWDKVIWQGVGCQVEAILLDHKTPVVGYIVREHARRNADLARMAALGLRPGPWVKHLKEAAKPGAMITVEGATYPTADLQRQILVESAGDSVAYLTDFLVEGAGAASLTQALNGCRALVCEAQYRHADIELARRHYHLTSVLAASLAREAGAGELILFHVSQRYSAAELRLLLEEARGIFLNSRFPSHWELDARQ